MAGPITIILLGEPVPFAIRTTSTGGRRYVPTKPRNASATLRRAAEEEVKSAGMAEPFDEPLRIDLLCEVAIPNSWSIKKKNAAILGMIRPGTRPDLTNILKLAEDALKQVVWRDDSLVVEQRTRKIYSKQPKLVLTVTPLGNALTLSNVA
jgi:Holliday junction resolvase RusA-like endonuclease